MKNIFAGILCCPFCGEEFTDQNYRIIHSQHGYGILKCECDKHPVVDGIPVFKTGIIGGYDKTKSGIVALIEQDRYKDALYELIFPPMGPQKFNARIKHPKFLRNVDILLQQRNHLKHVRTLKKKLRDFFDNADKSVSFYDYLNLYFRQIKSSTMDRNSFDYYYYRYGQPRHLEALSYATLVPESEKPVLDLACGFGHITRYLTNKSTTQKIIGADTNFFTLYMAKNIIAPEASYVCCDADEPLPFTGNSFSTIFCSDSFHSFQKKTTCVYESLRISDRNGLIILTTLRNIKLQHLYKGIPLSIEGYNHLFSNVPHRIIDDSSVLENYLQKKIPSLKNQLSFESLDKKEYVSIVASKNKKIFKDYGMFYQWPHALGHLKINPLYKINQKDAGNTIILKRTYPSEFYENENVKSKQYLPEEVEISTALLDDLKQGKPSTEIDDLIRKMVLVAIPDRYLNMNDQYINETIQ